MLGLTVYLYYLPILFTLFTFLASICSHYLMILQGAVHIIYPSWEDLLTLFTHSARICSHYLLILQGSVHIIYSSCRDMFIIFINLASIYPSCYDIHIIYSSCKDLFTLLFIMQWHFHNTYLSCKHLFTLCTHFARICSYYLSILQGPVHTFPSTNSTKTTHICQRYQRLY